MLVETFGQGREGSAWGQRMLEQAGSSNAVRGNSHVTLIIVILTFEVEDTHPSLPKFFARKVENSWSWERFPFPILNKPNSYRAISIFQAFTFSQAFLGGPLLCTFYILKVNHFYLWSRAGRWIFYSQASCSVHFFAISASQCSCLFCSVLTQSQTAYFRDKNKNIHTNTEATSLY